MSTEKSIADGFEPPKYVASLIAAINDGAKAAQGGLLLYMLVGLYLLASAFSSTDEDLLLGKAVTIAQIGAALPVSFTFAIAPLVFVFLHVYTLTRFDMLAANVRHFVKELRRSVLLRSDRERCLHLLSNVEFVMALTTEHDSTLHNGFWRWMVRGLLAGFPVLILLLVQINALRYQSQAIRWAQFAWLVVDLAALAWFFRRNALVDFAILPRWRAVLRRVALPGLPGFVVAFNLLWLNVVPDNADARVVRGERFTWRDVAWQPLDTLSCPHLGWGCRYLDVERRTLVGHVWDDKTMVALNGDQPDYSMLLPGIEGVDLLGRSLRFVVLKESRLFKADLAGAQLAGADLSGARLAGANLTFAQLAGADLSSAQLVGARLFGAQLAGARLLGAQLAGADLFGAQLVGANLSETQLAGANLAGAQLVGANLSEAQLAGANLSGLAGTQLAGVNLSGLAGTQLAGVNLSALAGAQLAGANLFGAQLAGADLSEAQLRGANLRDARAPLIVSDDQTDLALADMRGMDFSPLNKDERNRVSKDLAGIPQGDLRQLAEARLSSVLAGKGKPNWKLHFTASETEKVLVSSLGDSAFSEHPEWLIDQPNASWRSALADRLATELVGQNDAAADGVARRATEEMMSVDDEEDHLTGKAIACRLLAEADSSPPRLTLTRGVQALLADASIGVQLACPPRPSARP